MLSKKSKYAIKALVCLAKRYETKSLLKTSEIAAEENIPKKFLEAILVEMRNNGLILSKMGAHGGYYLSKHPEEVVLSHIIRISGGPIAMLPCVSLNFYEKCEECPSEEICSLRSVMMEVREATLKILSKTSLADLIRRENELQGIL
jgi:Rrf2 family protein